MKLKLTGLCLATTAILSGCNYLQPSNKDLALNNNDAPKDAWSSASEEKINTVHYMKQGWDDGTRADFWHMSQGSRFLPYDMFINLEQRDSEKLILEPDNIIKYRYIPQNKSYWNPDGLPIGFTKDVQKNRNDSSKIEASYAGLNCSACHTSVITYKGDAMLIDGAPTQADFQSFFTDMTAALKATYMDPKKFDRFAERMLKEQSDNPEARQQLLTELGEWTRIRNDREQMNKTKVAYGNARVDAFGEIFNAVSATNLRVPENASPPDAPVSYPFLWGTAQSDVVQWNGIASNKPPGPLARNAGEVLGVFGDIKVSNRFGKLGYKSSVQIKNLAVMEKWIEQLHPPAWPEDILPAINQDMAARGAKIYELNCASCHEKVAPMDTYRSVMVSQTEIGTDPVMARNALRTAYTGILQGQKTGVIGGDKFGEEALKAEILKNQVLGLLINQPFSTLTAAQIEYLKVKSSRPWKNPESYKARPLNGIWATAPYLHNGSVPTLDDLLKKPEERPETFKLGSWDIDPIKVGMAQNSASAFTFDTRLYGNSNKGHTYGTNLSPYNRKALIEYLKTL